MGEKQKTEKEIFDEKRALRRAEIEDLQEELKNLK